MTLIPSFADTRITMQTPAQAPALRRSSSVNTHHHTFESLRSPAPPLIISKPILHSKTLILLISGTLLLRKPPCQLRPTQTHANGPASSAAPPSHSCHRTCSRARAAMRQRSQAHRTCQYINTRCRTLPVLAARHAY